MAMLLRTVIHARYCTVTPSNRVLKKLGETFEKPPTPSQGAHLPVLNGSYTIGKTTLVCSSVESALALELRRICVRGYLGAHLGPTFSVSAWVSRVSRTHICYDLHPTEG